MVDLFLFMIIIIIAIIVFSILFIKKDALKPNKSIVSGYRLVSTLDTKTCLVCGSLDGEIFITENEALSHKCLNETCRCMALPEIKGMEGFDEDDMRTSADGPVSANMTYVEWLKKQPVARKKEILGKYYEQYKNGVSLEAIAKEASINE